MSLAAKRATLETSLQNTGLTRVYPEETEQAQPPCFVIGNPTGTYDDDFDGGLTYVFPVVLLISRAPGGDRAIRDIDPYIQTDGTASVPHAVNVGQQRVIGFTNFGGGYTIGTDEFVGVTFEVHVLAD